MVTCQPALADNSVRRAPKHATDYERREFLNYDGDKKNRGSFSTLTNPNVYFPPDHRASPQQNEPRNGRVFFVV